MTIGSADGPPSFRVLLSTHNGDRYLSDQIASVLAQRDVDLRLDVRDDDSADTTVELLSRLATADRRVSFSRGERLGPAASFLTMLSQTPADVDYVSLCDQDDVWIDGKLAKAASWLDTLSVPAMYCSAVDVVDEQLQPLEVHRTCRRGATIENALVQNIATGCTIVLNRQALHLFRNVPRSPVMHDAWIYAVIAATGKVLYDPQPWVLYRQHDENSIGLAASSSQQWVRRLRQHAAGGSHRVHTRQARELLQLLGDEMTPRASAAVTRFVIAQETMLGRIGYALTGPAFRQRRIDSVVYRLLSALGRI